MTFISANKDFLIFILCVSASFLFIYFGMGEPGEVKNELWISLSSIPMLIGSYFVSKSFFKRPTRDSFLSFIMFGSFLVIYFQFIYMVYGLEVKRGESLDQIEFLYFSLSIWLNSSISELKPTDEIRAWVTYQSILSYAYMGLFVAKLVHLVHQKSEPD